MKVCIYLEAENLVKRSGFKRAFEHQKEALKKIGMEVTTDPSGEYDILHLHWIGPKSLYYLKKAKREGKKVVVHAHSTGEYDLRDSFTLSNLVAPIYESYLNFFYNQSDFIFTPSVHAKKLLSQRLRKMILVVSNGVDRNKFRSSHKKRLLYRKNLGLHRFTVFSAGNVIPRKGVIDFIDVARQLPQFDFVWYGHRWGILSFYPRMHNKIRKRSFNVKFPGFVSDTPGAFSAGDVFFFPSYGENQPLVILETASLGIPMVVRDLAEYEGWLVHGENCLKGRTNSEFVSHLERLSSDKKLYKRLSEGANELAEANSLERVGKQLARLYNFVLNGRINE